MIPANHHHSSGIDKRVGLPLHVQLTDRLRQEITSGRWPPHTKLPSEREMCDRYDISRITVRQALSNLAYEGLVYSTPGKGSYVAEPPLHEELKPLRSFTEDARRQGKIASSRVLGAAVLAADAVIAKHLNLQTQEEIIRLKRLRLMDDLPVAIHTTCLPHHLCPDILRIDLDRRSLFEVLRSTYGLNPARADTALRAALARSKETEVLELASPAAVLIVDQTTYLDDGTVVEYLHGVYRGDSYTLHMGI